MVQRVILRVDGMGGETVRARVQAALEGVPGVSEAVVSLYRASAEVRFEAPCERGHLLEAVRRAGCRPEGEASGPGAG